MGSRRIVVGGVACAAALAVLVTRLAGGTIVLLLAAITCAGVGLAARRALTRTEPDRDRSGYAKTESLDWRSRAFRAPRLFFYLGLVTITQLTFRLPVGGLTLSDAFFFVSIVLTALRVLSSRFSVVQLIPQSMLGVGTLILTVGGIVSSLGAVDPLSSIGTLLRLVYLTAVWFLLGAVVLVRAEHVDRAVVCWISSAALTGAAAIVQFLFGDVVPSTTIFFGRMTGFTQHVNDLGGVTGIALAPAIVLTLSRSRAAPKRLFAGLCLLLIGAGLLLSGSVGGMVAAVIAVLVLLSSGRAMGRLLVILSLLALVATVTLAFSTDVDIATPAKRFAVATGSEGTQGDTLAVRLLTFEEAWERISENPFVGVGLVPANATLESGYRVHNMVFSLWLEAGILGAAGMVVILLSVARLVSLSARRAYNASEWRLAVALGAAFAAFVAFGMGAPVLFQRYGWAPAAIVTALRARQRVSPSHPDERTLVAN
ncbi:MAG: O-antigen ligase family protein [Actinobacteria bacterium]|nr:O-antigen ligase family protein [Actinomycetota bacterium]